jgi:glycosyltransferase involved in cell wall biosynthesis
MTTIAVTMVRDEADVIAATVSHMLAEVDAVIVADNLSHDETRPILDELEREHGDRLRIVDDYDPAYRQSEKMTALALRARLELGAEWIVPFDADEWWYSPFGRIADVLADVAPQWLITPAPLYDHVATAEDPDEVDPVRRLGFRRRAANPLPKVACRWRDDLRICQGNHDAEYRGRGTRFDELLVVRHFPYRSVAQLVQKVRNGAAAYTAAGESVPPTFGAHWRQWGALLETVGETALAEIFHAWYWREQPRATYRDPSGEVQPALIYDPAPGS